MSRANFDPSSGLRGVCAVLIVCGHFFDLYAPRSLRFFGFDASLPGCDGPDAKNMGRCYPPGSLDGAYPSVSIMYVTPVALFFAISGALFAYLYYDSFHVLDADALERAHKLSWCGFMAKRFRRVAPQLWASLLWLAPFFFFGSLGAPYSLDVKLMDLLVAPTPLFVVQPLLLMGLEWNPIMWQVSALFVCYMCVPALFGALKSDAIGRARCPASSAQHAPLELAVGGGGPSLLGSAYGVTGVGFWLCWLYSVSLFWTVYYALCDAECVATSLGEMLVHLTVYSRLPQFVMGFYVGLALKEEELTEELIRTGRVQLVIAGRACADTGIAAVERYRLATGVCSGWLRVLVVDGLFFGWLGAVALIGVTGDGWTGATRSTAYDFDWQFWLAPLHGLWLYHAARLPVGVPDGAYATLDDEAAAAVVAAPSPPPRSLAAAFLTSGPMLHLGKLSYGIYICQFGALTTVTWLHNGLSVPPPAAWLPDAGASWGTFGLEAWSLGEVWLLLLAVAQLVELLDERVRSGSAGVRDRV